MTPEDPTVSDFPPTARRAPWPAAEDTIAFGRPGAAEPVGERMPAPRRGPRRVTIVVSAALVMSLLLGGAAFAGAWVWFGWGTTQPEEVMPESTGLFLRVDLSPGLGQELKIDNLAKRFPDEDSSNAVDQLRRGLLRGMGLESLDFDTDIAPWFGDRLAVGRWGRDAQTRPCVLVALASKDDTKAAAALAKVRDRAGDDRYGYTFLNGYALSAECPGGGSQAIAEAAAADAKTRNLAQRPSFADSLSKLPGGQVVVGWVDLDALPGLMPIPDSVSAGGLADLGMLTGTLLAGARVVDNGIEVRFRVTSGTPPQPGRDVLSELDALPANTVIGAAAHLTDGAVDGIETRLEAALDNLGGVADLVLDGLDVLLGSTLSLSVTQIGEGGDDPAFRLVARAASPQQADTVENLLESLRRGAVVAGGGDGLEVERDGSRVLVTQGDYLGATGRLADAALYREAMAGVSGAATMAVFVDLQKLSPSLALGPAGEQRMRPVRAVGLTIGADRDAKVGLLRIVIR